MHADTREWELILSFAYPLISLARMRKNQGEEGRVRRTSRGARLLNYHVCADIHLAERCGTHQANFRKLGGYFIVFGAAVETASATLSDVPSSTPEVLQQPKWATRRGLVVEMGGEVVYKSSRLHEDTIRKKVVPLRASGARSCDGLHECLNQRRGDLTSRGGRHPPRS